MHIISTFRHSVAISSLRDLADDEDAVELTVGAASRFTDKTAIVVFTSKVPESTLILSGSNGAKGGGATSITLSGATGCFAQKLK